MPASRSAVSLPTRPRGRALALCLLLASLALPPAPGPAAAQEAEFEQLLVRREVTALVEAEGLLFAGLDGGGVVVLDAAAPDQVLDAWTSGGGIVGNIVSDLYWNGRRLWVATRDGGITSVGEPAGARITRIFTSNLASSHVTSLVGTDDADREIVYYGTDGAGLGVITDGVAGNIYTAALDGLLSDRVRGLAYLDGALYVATPAGVSRFADNLFTDASTGLADRDVRCLAVDENGVLLCGNSAGVHAYDAVAGTWSLIRDTVARVERISVGEDTVYALAVRDGALEAFYARVRGNWTGIALPVTDCSAVHAGTRVWIGGLRQTSSADGLRRDAYVGRLETGNAWTTWDLAGPLARNVEGITFGADGGPWIGDWSGQYASHRTDAGWEHIWERASAANDSTGRFPGGGNMLCMATTADGVVWIGQYAGGGLLRVAPDGAIDLVDPSVSGLDNKFIINLAAHPDGPLFVMHDAGGAQKVEVLIDTDAWRNPANWIDLPRETGLGGGESVWDAAVERRDVMWFAVRDVGLVRWDVNGDAAGPDDPLTWADQSDDRWDAPVRAFPGTALDPRAATGLAVDADGALWAGGSGVVQFAYDPQTRATTTLTAVGEKLVPGIQGLVNANVADIAIDANGHVWAATSTGLNRIRGTGEDFLVDAWLDLGNYFANPNYAVLYSPNVIAPLPGTSYRKLVADAAGRKLLLSADQGATLITVGQGGGPATEETGALAGVYCYPNPWSPEDGAGIDGWLKLGGFAADEPVDVEIYSLSGERLLAFDGVVPGVGVWDGTNAGNRPVATGMYVVRLTRDGETALRTLAIVR